MKYDPKRVLWVSCRMTLSYDIECKFRNFGFKLCADGDYNADRLIIQTESLLKLITDQDSIKKYDLIIIDEIESVLRQFSSPTFKGSAPKSFDLLVHLLKFPSTKVISLDGDFHNRGFNFVKYFGKSLNIDNVIKINKKTLNAMNQKQEFEKIFLILTTA